MYKDQISLLNIIVCEDDELRAAKGEPVSIFSPTIASNIVLKEYETREIVFCSPECDPGEMGLCINLRFAFPRYIVGLHKFWNIIV